MPSYNPSDFHPFAVTTDLVLIAIIAGRLKIMSVKREEAPFKEKRALPGGFLQPQENAMACAHRILGAKTDILHANYIEELSTFSDPKRDPRMRVVSIAHWGLTRNTKILHPTAAWISTTQAKNLAFDHASIVEKALERLASKLEYTSVATQLCPSPFTLAQLRNVYEIIWKTTLDPGNFQRKMKANALFEEDSMLSSGTGRPAKQYRCKKVQLLSVPILRAKP